MGRWETHREGRYINKNGEATSKMCGTLHPIHIDTKAHGITTVNGSGRIVKLLPFQYWHIKNTDIIGNYWRSTISILQKPNIGSGSICTVIKYRNEQTKDQNGSIDGINNFKWERRVLVHVIKYRKITAYIPIAIIINHWKNNNQSGGDCWGWRPENNGDHIFECMPGNPISDNDKYVQHINAAMDVTK